MHPLSHLLHLQIQCQRPIVPTSKYFGMGIYFIIESLFDNMYFLK